VSLHFVRNHGAVPKVNHEMAAKWTIRVHGLVEQEVTFTLQELQAKFPVVTLPVTLACAGNRRKEQNVVRKTLGNTMSSVNGPLDGRLLGRYIGSRETHSWTS